MPNRQRLCTKWQEQQTSAGGPGDKSNKKELRVQQAARTRTVALTRSGRVLSGSNSIQFWSEFDKQHAGQ